MNEAGGATALFHLMNLDYEMELFQNRIALVPVPLVYYSSLSAHRVASLCQPYRLAVTYVYKSATMDSQRARLSQINNFKTSYMSNAIVNSILYSFLGIAVLIVAFVLVEVLTPKHDLRHEILEKQNLAVAVLAGFFMLAIAIIVASAIH